MSHATCFPCLYSQLRHDGSSRLIAASSIVRVVVANPSASPLLCGSFLYFGTACFCVHSLAVAIAACSFSFQLLATSGASGSSGFGAPRRAWIESRIVRICRAGDQLSVVTQCKLSSMANIYSSLDLLFRTSRQMRPSLSTLGWKILVRNLIFGGVMG